MAIQLKKGSRISLKKEAPGLEKIMLGLGWDMAMTESRSGLFNFFKKTGSNIDLDAGVLCLNSAGKLSCTKDYIYYANLNHYSGAINHQGDNLTGEGDGDDERIFVDLEGVPAGIESLLFAVTIYKATGRKQEFSQVRNAFVRLVNLRNNKEIANFTLSGETYKGKTGLLMAELRRSSEGWSMIALGEGLNPAQSSNLIRHYQ